MKELLDLPIDHILPIIFQNLSIEDLLTCRLVNKLFKHFSDHTNCLNKLIIGQPNSEYDNFFWYYNNKSIEYKDIISLKCFRTIQKLSIFNLDTNLKYLKIYDEEFKLEEISNLINLESIEFGHYHLNNNQEILNLNNLKVFVIKGHSVQLNTPLLEKIEFYDINRIKLNSNPESIKHLITSSYDNKFEIFKNLEIMELRYLYLPTNENLLSLFKNLRQLKINLNKNSVNYSMGDNLIKILNDKIKLKRLIDIYLEGVKIENIDQFNELASIKICEYWKFRLNNYDLLDLNLSTINYLKYHKLEKYVNNIKNDLPSSFFDKFIDYLYCFRLEKCVNNMKNDLPSSFFDKFIHINYVNVSSVKDIDRLNWFLNKLKYLNRLKIHTRLNQGFYDKLPNTIRYLIIDDKEDINYDFILKLSKLIQFKINFHKDIDLFDLAFTSFLDLKYLQKFEYNWNIIEKKGKYFNLNKRRGLDYNQLIEECNKIRSK